MSITNVLIMCLTGFIALTHVHKETPWLHMRKGYRISIRLSVALILICLPLADRLNSIQLVGSTTSLVVFVLGTELWCASCGHDSLWDNSKCCGYVGYCGRKDLEAMTRPVEGVFDADTLIKEIMRMYQTGSPSGQFSLESH